LKLVIPRFDFFNFEKSFKKNYTYIFPDFLVEHIARDSINRTGLLPFESIIDLKYFLIPYNYERDKNFKPNIILIRTGGYGDVIALSSLVRYLFDNDLVNNLIFITEKDKIIKWFSIYDNLYNKRFFVGNISTPLNKFPFLYKNKELDQENIRYIIYEGVIEKDKKHNWYELFFKHIGIENVDSEYKRPSLKKETKIHDILFKVKPKNKKSIVLTLSSTSYIRSFPYLKLLNELLKRNYFVIVFNHHLNKLDRKLIKNKILYEINSENWINNLYIVNFDLDINEYLNILYHADLTISVDTLTTHFREGINKKSINIYISFPSWARSKYYKYTINIDLKSSCELQPCFIHTKRKEEKCPKYKEKITQDIFNYFPPCVIELEDKIIEEVLKYL